MGIIEDIVPNRI